MNLLGAFTNREPRRFRSIKYKISGNRGSTTIHQSIDSPVNISFNPNSTCYSSYKENKPFTRFMTAKKKHRNSAEGHLKSQHIKEFQDLQNRYTVNSKKDKNDQVLDRVQLPTLIEGDSHFTALDNINLPINYIKVEISKIENGLKEEVSKMAKISTDIKKIEIRRNEQMQQVKKYGEQAFKNLRKMLHINKAKQQSYLLKTKRQINEWKNGIPEICQKIEESKMRLVKIQENIFENRPFELKFNEDYQVQADNTLYF